MLTVGDLILELQKHDETLPVLLYIKVSEDGDSAAGVRVETEEDANHHRGDHPFDHESYFTRMPKKAVTIFSS